MGGRTITLKIKYANFDLITRSRTLREYVADQSLVDGSVNLLAGWTYSLGLSLRSIQTGKIRQYVMFIVIGAITIFVLISFFWSPTLPAAPKTAPSGRGSAPAAHPENNHPPRD